MNGDVQASQQSNLAADSTLEGAQSLLTEAHLQHEVRVHARKLIWAVSCRCMPRPPRALLQLAADWILCNCRLPLPRDSACGVQGHADGLTSVQSDSEADVVESLHGWVQRPASRAASSQSDRELRHQQAQQADEQQAAEQLQQPHSRAAAHASHAAHPSMLDDGIDLDESMETELDGLIQTPMFPVYIEDETESQLDELNEVSRARCCEACLCTCASRHSCLPACSVPNASNSI